MPSESQVLVKTIEVVAGGFSYKVDPEGHSHAFVVHFGGLYQGRKLIGVSCLFYAANEEAKLRCLEYAITVTDGFVPVRSPNHEVRQFGPMALDMLRSGFPVQTNRTDWDIISLDAIPKRKRR